MEYLHLFNSESDFTEAYNGSSYKEPWVSATNTGGGATNSYRVDYNNLERKKLETPLTFEIIGDGNIVWKKATTATTLENVIEYSINGGEWESITANTTGGAQIAVVSGDTVQFRGDNQRYATDNYYHNTFNRSTAQFNVKGNIMSLVNSTDFNNLTTLQSAYTFCYLFANCTGLTDASKLLLPATTLAQNCYYAMFYGCTSLIKAPELPATTLADNCYAYMFQNCRSLTTVPELPATTLTDCCYEAMFSYCTSLTAAPELPATTLANYCYNEMFIGCSGLTTAPELPATTLAYGCYSFMFGECSSLNYIKCLATNISASYCINNWLYGVASTGTFVKNPSMTSWTTGESGIPTNWTVVDAIVDA